MLKEKIETLVDGTLIRYIIRKEEDHLGEIFTDDGLKCFKLLASKSANCNAVAAWPIYDYGNYHEISEAEAMLYILEGK